MGVLTPFFPGGWGIRPSKKVPGGWSGLELTDTLYEASGVGISIYKRGTHQSRSKPLS